MAIDVGGGNSSRKRRERQRAAARRLKLEMTPEGRSLLALAGPLNNVPPVGTFNTFAGTGVQSTPGQYSSNPEVNALSNQLERSRNRAAYEGVTPPEPHDPGLLERVFDVLSRGNYAAAEGIDRLFGGSLSDPNIELPNPVQLARNLDDAAKGAWEGVTGREKTTFGGIIGEYESKRPKEEQTPGWLQGLVGFAGDVFLDPTTYIGLGIGKQLGKEAVQRAGLGGIRSLSEEVIEEATDKAAREAVEALGETSSKATRAKARNKAIFETRKQMTERAFKRAVDEAKSANPGRVHLQILGRNIGPGSTTLYRAGRAPVQAFARTKIGEILDRAFRTRKLFPGELNLIRRNIEGLGLAHLDEIAEEWDSFTKGLSKADAIRIARAMDVGEQLDGRLGEIQTETRRILDKLFHDEVDAIDGVFEEYPYRKNYVPHYYQNRKADKYQQFKNARKAFGADEAGFEKAREIAVTFDDAIKAGLDPILDIREIVMHRIGEHARMLARDKFKRAIADNFGIFPDNEVKVKALIGEAKKTVPSDMTPDEAVSKVVTETAKHIPTEVPVAEAKKIIEISKKEVLNDFGKKVKIKEVDKDPLTEGRRWISDDGLWEIREIKALSSPRAGRAVGGEAEKGSRLAYDIIHRPTGQAIQAENLPGARNYIGNPDAWEAFHKEGYVGLKGQETTGLPANFEPSKGVGRTATSKVVGNVEEMRSLQRKLVNLDGQIEAAIEAGDQKALAALRKQYDQTETKLAKLQYGADTPTPILKENDPKRRITSEEFENLKQPGEFISRLLKDPPKAPKPPKTSSLTETVFPNVGKLKETYTVSLPSIPAGKVRLFRFTNGGREGFYASTPLTGFGTTGYYIDVDPALVKKFAAAEAGAEGDYILRANAFKELKTTPKKIDWKTATSKPYELSDWELTKAPKEVPKQAAKRFSPPSKSTQTRRAKVADQLGDVATPEVPSPYPPVNPERIGGEGPESMVPVFNEAAQRAAREKAEREAAQIEAIDQQTGTIAPEQLDDYSDITGDLDADMPLSEDVPDLTDEAVTPTDTPAATLAQGAAEAAEEAASGADETLTEIFQTKNLTANEAKARIAALKELGFEEVKDIKGLEGWWLPKDISYVLKSIDEVYNNDTVAHELLRYYDKALKEWKTLATVVNPGHHIRNAMGDAFLNWLDDVNPKHYLRGRKILSRVRNNADPDKPIYRVGSQMFSANQLNRAYKDSGLHAGFFHDELGSISRKIYKGPRMIAERREEIFRFAHFLDIIEKEGKKIKKWSDRPIDDLYKIAQTEASKRVRKFNLDYGDFTDFERKVMKRIIPFYSFMRKNIPLQLEMIFLRPGKIAKVPKSVRAIETILGTDDDVDAYSRFEKTAPEWLREAATTAPRITGGENPLFAGIGAVPLQDINRLNFIKSLIGGEGKQAFQEASREVVSSTTPGLKLPVEAAFNTNVYTGQELPASSFQYSAQQFPVSRQIINLFDQERSGERKGQDLVNYLTGAGLQQITDERKIGELRRQSDPLKRIIAEINKRNARGDRPSRLR